MVGWWWPWRLHTLVCSNIASLACLIFVTQCCLLPVVAAAKPQLRFVHAIWRHGDRSPARDTFPTDTGNLVNTWPQGWGELTTIGMKQHFELGNYLKKRYGEFLSQNYSAFEIYVRSTSYNRTIMSALSNFAGFYYPPAGDQVINNTIPWTPVPIHSWPKGSDYLLDMDANCTKADEFEAQEYKSDAAIQFAKKYENFMRIVSEKSGWTIDVFNVSKIYDALFCERNHLDEHSWPSWVNDSVFEEIAHVFHESSLFLFNSPEWKYLRGGLLLGDILDRMQVRAGFRNNETFDPRLKYVAYSAHDTTLIALLQTLGAMGPHNPPYASVVLIELLYEEDSKNWFVEVYYRNDSNREPYLLEVSDCPYPCKLLTFAERSANLIPASLEEWNEKCGNRNGEDDFNFFKWLAVGSGVANILLCFLLTLVVVMFCNKNGKLQPIHFREDDVIHDDEARVLINS